MAAALCRACDLPPVGWEWAMVVDDGTLPLVHGEAVACSAGGVRHRSSNAKWLKEALAEMSAEGPKTAADGMRRNPSP